MKYFKWLFELSKEYKIFALIAMIVVVSLVIYFLDNYKIYSDRFSINKKQNIIFNINLTNKKDFTDYEFKINEKSCEKTNLNTYSCDELRMGKYSYTLGKFKGEIDIKDNEYTYTIPVNNVNYLIDSHNLFLEKNKFKGKLSIKNEYGGYKDLNKLISNTIELYSTELIIDKKKNGYITFEKMWDEFSDIYYSNKTLYTEYTIDNNIYKASKYYLLSKDLDINKVFSISYNDNEAQLNINDYLKINNNLIVYDKSNIPNINLIKLNLSEESDLYGFIKFNIINLHKDAKINFYFGKNYLFSIASFNYYLPQDSKNKLSKYTRIEPMSQTEKHIKLKNNYLIEKVEIIFSKEKDNCKIKIITDKHRPVTSNITCNTKELKFEENKSINFQLNIEAPNTCINSDNCILFEISDIITGIDKNEILK